MKLLTMTYKAWMTLPKQLSSFTLYHSIPHLLCPKFNGLLLVHKRKLPQGFSACTVIFLQNFYQVICRSTYCHIGLSLYAAFTQSPFLTILDNAPTLFYVIKFLVSFLALIRTIDIVFAYLFRKYQNLALNCCYIHIYH